MPLPCLNEETAKALRDAIERSNRRHRVLVERIHEKKIVQPPPVPPDTDRMWDLLVLAARTSRYGE